LSRVVQQVGGHRPRTTRAEGRRRSVASTRDPIRATSSRERLAWRVARCISDGRAHEARRERKRETARPEGRGVSRGRGGQLEPAFREVAEADFSRYDEVKKGEKPGRPFDQVDRAGWRRPGARMKPHTQSRRKEVEKVVAGWASIPGHGGGRRGTSSRADDCESKSEW